MLKDILISFLFNNPRALIIFLNVRESFDVAGIVYNSLLSQVRSNKKCLFFLVNKTFFKI